ncbi:MAG: hypothetical protein HKP61_09250 [Dactylosporangium sp.]|nr:hypothetical protein [Dactylosporangium sp.]NNJ61118.1 hypothetical protein [Dactylosporangium sp.]
MTARRSTLIVTGAIVTALGLIFVTVGWNRASTLAGVVAALAGVACAGITVWTGLRAGGGDASSTAGSSRIRVKKTGSIKQTGVGPKVANTGVAGLSTNSTGSLEAAGTGGIEQDGDGWANTGVRGA